MHYFTADQHLGHKNVIKYCDRPFKNVEEMDKALIENINNRVKKNDELSIVGDFCICRTQKVVRKYRNMIKCKRINLILGNHDPIKKNLQPKKWLFDIFDIVAHQYVAIFNKMQPFFLSHYPLATNFPTSKWGGIHLFGHLHDKEFINISNRKRLNVGVDQHNFSPLSAEEIIEFFQNK